MHASTSEPQRRRRPRGDGDGEAVPGTWAGARAQRLWTVCSGRCDPKTALMESIRNKARRQKNASPEWQCVRFMQRTLCATFPMMKGPCVCVCGVGGDRTASVNVLTYLRKHADFARTWRAVPGPRSRSLCPPPAPFGREHRLPGTWRFHLALGYPELLDTRMLSAT